MDLNLLKQELTTINDIIYFDEEAFLREKTSDPLKMRQIIQWAESLLKDCDERDVYFLSASLGNLYRVNKQPQKAIPYLRNCLEQAKVDGNANREVVSLIRLGEAYKYDDGHEKALLCFQQALEICDLQQVIDYVDFALQHKGKCLMELGRLTEAENCFLQALSIRETKGDQSLIESTEQALSHVKTLRQKEFEG